MNNDEKNRSVLFSKLFPVILKIDELIAEHELTFGDVKILLKYYDEQIDKQINEAMSLAR